MALFLTIIRAILRLCSVAILVLGVLLWTGNFDNLKPFHMIIGILIVLGLWTLGIAQALRGGSPTLAGAALVLGAIVLVVGLSQEQILAADSDPHWVVQVIHFTLGISTLALVDISGARAKRTLDAGPTPSFSPTAVQE